MQHKKNQKKAFISPFTIIASALLAIMTVGSIFFLLLAINQPDDSPSRSSVDSNVNYNPPTTEEITGGQSIKDANENKNAQIIADYSIFIVDAAQYEQNVEVRSYVEGIIQDDGTCTFTFTQGTVTITKTSNSFADAAHTTCRPLIVSTAEFPNSGIWTLLISYTSGDIIIYSVNQDVAVQK
jgi:hypothetical protein